MFSKFVTITAITLASLTFAQSSQASTTDGYRCDVGGQFNFVTIMPEEGIAQFESANGSSQLVPTGNGSYYNDQAEISFEPHGRSAELWLGDVDFECKLMLADNEKSAAKASISNETLLAYAGRSLGGKLRSGPGTNFNQIGSLPEGTWLTINTNSGVGFDGYDWFGVATDDGLQGYMWGGIMCSNGTRIEGIFERCYNPEEIVVNTQNHASGAVGGNEVKLNVVGRSLGGKLRNGPGTNFGQSGSLAEGTWVTILTNTGVNFDGYDWFEVTTDNGQRGYQWGGIMCSNGQRIKGIYQQCQSPAQTTSNNQTQNASGWMAFAVGDNGVWGHGAGRTQNDAINYARQNCQGANCQIADVTQAKCHALSTVPGGLWFGTANSKAQAENYAQGFCTNAGASGCRVEYSYCQ